MDPPKVDPRAPLVHDSSYSTVNTLNLSVTKPTFGISKAETFAARGDARRRRRRPSPRDATRDDEHALSR